MKDPGIRPRAIVVVFALVGLATVGACVSAPSPSDTKPADDLATSAPPHVGVFSGRYLDGQPVYVFPPIVVVGHRAND